MGTILAVQSLYTSLSIRARAETIGSSHSTIATFSAPASFGGSAAALRPPPHLPMVGLSTIYRLPSNDTTISHLLLVLVHKQRLATPMIFSSESELTLMVRLTDSLGDPDLTQSTDVSFYLSQKQGFMVDLWNGIATRNGGILLPASHFQDGWYGMQFRGDLLAADIQVSIRIQTYDSLGRTDSQRIFAMGTTEGITTGRRLLDTTPPYVLQPGFHLTVGAQYIECPWDARWPGVVTGTIQVLLANPLLTPCCDFVSSLACAINIPPNRIQVTLRNTDILIVSITAESFLRLRDVYLSMSNTSLLQSATGLSIVSSTRSEERYNLIAPDPNTTCPPNKYYSDQGRFEALPLHSRAGWGCYGIVCDPGYTLVNSHCIPPYSTDDIYWTVVGLVIMLVLWSLVAAVGVRVCCASNNNINKVEAPPQKTPPPEENMLPIMTNENGELVFFGEEEEEEDGDSNSTTSTISQQSAPETPI